SELSVLFQEKLSSGTPADIAAVETAATAINPEKASVIQSVGVAHQNTIASLVTGRILAPGIGRAGGDSGVDFGGIWAQGLYNKSKLNDVFNGYTRGGAVGFDGTINEVWTLGAGYMYAHSDISAQTRNTEIDSSTMFIYGQYKPGAWYANAIVNYTMSDYSENGSALGVPVSADYDVDIFGGRIATGYDFIGGLTPEVAMQYMHINASDYTNSLGVWNHFGNADYLTASIGTKYEFGWVLNNGIVMRPQMHYALKYDLISDDHNVTVTMPGVNAYVLNGERLSRIANEVGIGLAMNYGGFEMSLNYDIESRADYTSQTGRVKFRYEF
ncbi:MAG: autotransporter outer membrane beta-barrel domain-containing protein, partial [Alphaproteobacteria bacterium]|nr:autotransporter outer membrane beta-barrel domain-containing protein [Alphaproteobacteria bacterium]